MSHRYNFTPASPEGVYIILPVDDAPPLKVGRCVIGYQQAVLTPYSANGVAQIPNHWVVEKYWTELYTDPEFSNTVAQ